MLGAARSSIGTLMILELLDVHIDPLASTTFAEWWGFLGIQQIFRLSDKDDAECVASIAGLIFGADP